MKKGDDISGGNVNERRRRRADSQVDNETEHFIRDGGGDARRGKKVRELVKRPRSRAVV